jgi:ABC-type sulfate transport system permease subunit
MGEWGSVVILSKCIRIDLNRLLLHTSHIFSRYIHTQTYGIQVYTYNYIYTVLYNTICYYICIHYVRVFCIDVHTYIYICI